MHIYLMRGYAYHRFDQRRITPLEEVLFECNSNLVSELQHLSNSGRIGAIRAVVSAGDMGMLCKPLAVESSHETQGPPHLMKSMNFEGFFSVGLHHSLFLQVAF